ncbi:hypothetical protein [Amycolatopsis echigonensis]|uniref:Uncharacterized protein n=1 Tax=Amycolatopsis echigonensis TaxID=2576905 RepID=A0A2N3WQC9_9PSEU|nr:MULTISPECIES: hypothetical protein [Amycolatopsis]MBB2502793.1 hypothetical protein [Amycolatopsis echigonensis]PKV96069.1 hypothetical protein ATK30_7005 [Amycolatopsis niigatensis]
MYWPVLAVLAIGVLALGSAGLRALPKAAPARKEALAGAWLVAASGVVWWASAPAVGAVFLVIGAAVVFGAALINGELPSR